MVDKIHPLNSQPGFNPLPDGEADQPQPEGICLDSLPVGAVLELQTGHHLYHFENLGDGKAMISGHPQYCPEPAEVQVHGSLWGAGLLKWGFIGKGMKLEFTHPLSGLIRTSRIQEIHRAQPAVGPN